MKLIGNLYDIIHTSIISDFEQELSNLSADIQRRYFMRAKVLQEPVNSMEHSAAE